MSKLEPWERKDFYEFVRSQAQPTGQATTPKNLNEMLELFNKLDPGERETLRINREIAEAEPGPKQGMSEDVRLKLENEVAAQKTMAEDARTIASDLDRIRAMAMPPDSSRTSTASASTRRRSSRRRRCCSACSPGPASARRWSSRPATTSSTPSSSSRRTSSGSSKWLLAETAVLTAASVATKGLGLLIWGLRLKRMVARLKMVKR